jgi:hypothetical protein
VGVRCSKAGINGFTVAVRIPASNCAASTASPTDNASANIGDIADVTAVVFGPGYPTKWANSVVQCVGPGFAQLLYGDAFRIVVLAALMFAIRSWPALLP